MKQCYKIEARGGNLGQYVIGYVMLDQGKIVYGTFEQGIVFSESRGKAIIDSLRSLEIHHQNKFSYILTPSERD